MAEEDVKVTLHWLNGSRAQGTLWLLEELQIPYELDRYHRLPNKLAPPELEKLHPLGKAPVVSVKAPGASEPMVLAESPFIAQYLSEHFTSHKKLLPDRWKPGQEGKVGGETEEWMRCQYLLYYVEGSFMMRLVLNLVLSALKGPNIPFFIRPLTRAISNQMIGLLVFPDMKKSFTMLEKFLETAPSGGPYICGPNLTAADIMLGYPLIAGKDGAWEELGKWEKGSWKETFPKLHAYSERLSQEPGWLKSVEKIKEIEGSFAIRP
ncbi:hypothetical protein QBC46DRAFT_378711 [Diplogelasinospora grovesii]|uniref:Glutathione S-transferase n=1 Tax=Diplogelasinospora grovesii TaxID=303347 RepID=A0AAN6S781_9PEZI|nr:hypothetical protein QBC46DRAFT_378711 [Diplogelasinospora grovesii]